MVADVEDAEPVHLTRLGAHGVDHDRALVDHLLKALLDEVRAVLLLGDGLVHVLGEHVIVVRLARPETGLGDDVGDVQQTSRELALVVAQPAALLDEPRHG